MPCPENRVYICATTFSITTFDIMTTSIMLSVVYALGHVFDIVMLNVVSP
jgi:hypothetical protein